MEHSPYRRWQKSVSAALVGVLLFSATFEIPLSIPRAEASALKRHVDLVSILVEKELYRKLDGVLSNPVADYAKALQRSLRDTRSVIVPVSASEEPRLIAALNEKLYRNGEETTRIDGTVEQLAGTVLIGRVPLPVVRAGGKPALSVAPYADFDDKKFRWDESAGTFSDAWESSGFKPEIWHGVIDPNTGDAAKDAQKVREFLEKAVRAHAGTDEFADDGTQKPYVLWFDAPREAASVNPADWRSYSSLYLPNQETIAYRRFTKYLAKWAYDAYQELSADPEAAIAPFENWNGSLSGASKAAFPTEGLSDDAKKLLAKASGAGVDMSQLPDANAGEFVGKAVKRYAEVVNSAYLGDIAKYVYGAGRWNDGNVARVDTPAVLITKKDAATAAALKEANAAVETVIDAYVRKNLAQAVPALSSVEVGASFSKDGRSASATVEYSNRFYGLAAADAASAKDCSLTLGSTLTGSSPYVTEANAAYDVRKGETHAIELLGNADGAHAGAVSDVPGNEKASAALCSDAASGRLRTAAYWGGNSPLNVASGATVVAPGASDPRGYSSFSRPISDVGGSRQLAAGSPLKVSSPLDCLKNDLVLKPFSYQLTDWEHHGLSTVTVMRPRGWPRDAAFLPKALRDNDKVWGEAVNPVDSAKLGKDYSCATRFDLSTEDDAVLNAIKHNGAYDNRGGAALDLSASAGMSKNFYDLYAGGTCAGASSEGSFLTCGGGSPAALGLALKNASGVSQSVTKVRFKKVDSVLEHKSPTDEEYGAIARNMATPSMPVDRDRYVSFVSTKRDEEKIHYPNFFRISLSSPEDFTAEKAEALVKAELDKASAALNAAADKNDPAKATSEERAIRALLGGAASKGETVDLWKQVSGDAEMKAVLVESVLWANLRNAPAKYGYVLENWLSGSGRTAISPALNPSHRKNGYEVAWLSGEGDATAMDLSPDPSATGASSLTAANLAKNARLDAALRAANLASGGATSTFDDKASSKVFECGPADGVEITKWIPAIMCWLKSNMPPKIRWTGKNSDGSSDSSGPDLSVDDDSDGVSDAYESAVGDPRAKVELSSDKGSYGLSDSATVTAALRGADGEILDWDNRTVVSFAVTKISADEDGKTKTWTPASGSGAWNAALAKYVDFAPADVRVSGGEASYALSGRGKAAEVTVSAKTTVRDLNGDAVPSLSKEDSLAVTFEEPNLRVSWQAGEPGGEMSSGADYVAGDDRGIVFSILPADPKKPVRLPVKWSAEDSSGNPVASGSVAALSDGQWIYRWVPANEKVLSRADTYSFRFADARGFEDSAEIAVVPADASKLSLSAPSDWLVAGADYDALLKLEDRFGNAVAGNSTPADISVSGPATVAVGKNSGSASASAYLFEGWASAKLRASGDGSETVSAKITTDAGKTLSAELKLRSVSDATAALSFSGGVQPRVGGGSYPFTLTVRAKDGSVIPVNTVATFSFPEALGTVEPASALVQSGSVTAVLKTGSAAAKSARLKADVPGVSRYSGNDFPVLPGDPFSVGVEVSSARIVANGTDSVTAHAVLRDRFGNAAFDASGYSAAFSLDGGDSLRFASGQTLSQPFKEGETADVSLVSTNFAGTAYVSAAVTPGLEKNSFTYVDPEDSSKSVTVNGVSSNSAAVRSAYVLDAGRVSGMRYNSLVTGLLGGPYGDSTQRGYLGGALLFSEGSKAVAAVSLLNSPKSADAALEFSPDGSLAMNATDGASDLSAEWAVRDGVPAADFFDRLEKTPLARAWLRVDPTASEQKACAADNEGDKVSSCVSGTGGAVALAGDSAAGTEAAKEGAYLVLRSGTDEIARVSVTGMVTGEGVAAEPEAGLGGMRLALSYNGERVGTLLLRFPGTGVDLVKAGAAREAGRVSVEILSPRFSASAVHSGKSGSEAMGVAVSAAGSETDAADTSSAVPGFSQAGGETDGIGWAGANKTALEIAAGVPVGEAVRKYQDWSTVVLGDPAFNLPKRAEKRADGSVPEYDHTVGRSVATPDKPLSGFDLADVDGNGDKDVLAYLQDGSVQWWADMDGAYKPISVLLRAPDVGDGKRVAGDFFGDRHADVVGVTSKGRLAVFENTGGQFARIPAAIDGEGLKGRVVQMEKYDMDADGKDDLVVADDAGVLSVLYGTEGKSFRQVVVDRALGASLDPRSLSGTLADAAASYSSYGGTDPVKTAATELSPSSAAENEKATAEQQATVMNSFLFYSTTVPSVPAETAPRYTVPADAGSTFSRLSGTDENGAPLSDGSEIAQGLRDLASRSPRGSVDYSGIDSALDEGTKVSMLKSPYLPDAVSLKKSYSGSLAEGNLIDATLTVTNAGSETLRGLVVADKDAAAFRPETADNFSLRYAGSSSEIVAAEDPAGAYSFLYDLRKYPLAPGQSLKISYTLEVPRVSVGKISVGGFEEAGDGSDGNDAYGDILYQPYKSCGASRMFWWSKDSGAGREFARGSKTYSDDSFQTATGSAQEARCSLLAAEAVAAKASGGTVPTSFGTCSATDTDPAAYGQSALKKYDADSDGNGIPDRSEDDGFGIGDRFSDAAVDVDASGGDSTLAFSIDTSALESKMDSFVQGLGCGFGGGGCIATPVNYAPLAPGATPVVFGMPVNPSALTPYTWGVPVFAAPTWCSVHPGVWPPCAIGAGGLIMGYVPLSQFRLYVTPTLTGAMGTTMCFGPNLSSWAWTLGVSPLLPGGNCINIAMPLLKCGGDGSDGDVSSVTNASASDSDGGASYVNSESCDQSAPVDWSAAESDAAALRSDARAWLASSGNNLRAGSSFLDRAQRNPNAAKMPFEGPLVQIQGLGGSDEDALFGLDVDVSSKPGEIIKFKNFRTPAFPDFLMDWVTRQTEEIVNKLLTMPRLLITLPDFSGLSAAGAQWSNLFADLKKGYVTARDAQKEKNKAAKEKKDKAVTEAAGFAPKAQSRAISKATSALNRARGGLPLDSASETVSGFRAAMEVVSNLPFIDVDWETIRVSVPWFGGEDLKAWIAKNEAIWEADKAEINRFKKVIDDLKNTDPARWAQFVRLNADLDGLLRSIEQNVKIVKEYKDFPKKLSKYVRWKEKYVNEVVTNYLEPIASLLGGWISDNGRRFKAWVELVVLIKAILKSWQVILDIFADMDAQCRVCRVERYNMMYFLFKLLSALIPKIPVITFPKWPDIELDLHDIALGVRLTMPDFDFGVTPIKLPTLVPRIYLPDVPPAGLDINLSLPSIPLLPRLPELPDLPDLPILPLPILPDLPPPPKLPKLFAAIAAVLNLFRILMKVYCILRKNPFAPELDAGTILAILTDRSGPLPIDFLFLDFGYNPSVSGLDRIRVATHVNFKFDVDFIAEMARQALNPVTRTADGLSDAVRNFRVPDIDLRNLLPDSGEGMQLNLNVGADGKVDTSGSNLPGLPTGGPQGSLAPSFLQKIAGSVNALEKALADARDKKAGANDLREDLSAAAAMLRGTGEKRYAEAAGTLKRALAYDGRAEDEFTEKLKDESAARIASYADLFREEGRKAARQAAEIEAAYASPSAAGAGVLAAKLAGASLASSEAASADFSPYAEKLAAALENAANPAPDARFADMGAEKSRLLAQVSFGASSLARSLAASAAAVADSGGSATGGSDTGQKYDYSGVYVLSGGRQERLADYVAETDGTTKVVPGADGVFYSMGGSVWYKRKLAADDRGAILSNVDVLSDKDVRKEVLGVSLEGTAADVRLDPDSFRAVSDDSGKFDFSFRPENAARDSHFRIQAFRNPTFAAGKDPESGESRERWIFELFAGLDGKSYDPERTEAGALGWSHAATFHEASVGTATVTQNAVWRMLLPGGKYREGLDGAEQSLSGSFVATAGRALYTGYREAEVKWTDREGKTGRKYLAPRSRYAFEDDRTVEVLKGEIYLFGENRETVVRDFKDLAGMPVLPGAVIGVDRGGRMTLSFNDGRHVTVPENTHFALVDLGENAESYAGSAGVPDGFYSATVRSVDRSQDVAGLATGLGWQTLFAPARENDQDAPSLQLGSALRVPVNAARIVDFRKYALDPDDIASLKVEGLAEEQSSRASEKSSPALWKFGPFPSAGKRPVRVTACDANENCDSWTLALVASVPDAALETAETDGRSFLAEGTVAPEEADVPVQVYRFRDGRVEKASDKPLMTDFDGVFSLTGTSVGQAVFYGADGKEAARFDAETGAPASLAAGWSAEFVPASSADAAHLALKDPSGTVRYRQYWALAMPADLAEAPREGAVPETGNGWWYVAENPNDPSALRLEAASAADPSVPNGAYLVTDKDSRPALALSAGGQVYLAGPGASLEYATDADGWPSLKVSVKGARVGTLHLRAAGAYVNE